MKKTVFFVLLACLTISNVLFAGGQKESDDPNAPITINYWTHEDPNRTKLEKRYIEEFETAHPNVTINRVVNSSSKMKELILTAFAANQGPDIFNIPIEDEYSYIVNQRVAPVNLEAIGIKNNKELANRYIPNVLDSVYMDGQYYGLPLELTNWCIYVNKNVFKDAGLNPDKDYPKTWEEMASVSEKLTIHDGQIVTRRGFDFRYPYYLVSMLPMVEQLGGKLISDDGKKAIINDEAWIAFFDYMRAWGPAGKNLGSPTYTNARKLFNSNNNDIGMAMSGLYQIGRIKSDNPGFYDSGNWMVVPYPVFENAVRDVACNYYGHYLMVNAQKSNRQQQVSWEFIKYMLSHPEEYLEEVGIIQPTKKLMSSKTFTSMPYSDVFANDMAKSHMVYYGENSAKLQELVGEAVESVMHLGRSSEQALELLRAKSQEILDR
ncbi:MAG TPA: extracellular solute-binding protein [Treponemataceae bacterium]|nr:extracellular solute-binding protein [Treponemataceae bacterium]